MKMNEAAKITVQNLLTVKSIVTIMLTVVFFLIWQWWGASAENSF